MNLGYDLVYNDFGLLEQISQTDLGPLMKIYYLSDGTKYRMEDIVNEDLSDGPFYDRLYIGSMIFVKTSEDSTYSLESISVPGGQIVPDGDGGYRYRHFVTDHLGSVRAVIDGASVSRTADYLPYGTSNNTADSLQFRWQFNGKEKIPNNDVPYYDYGARLYDTSIGRWLTQDPLADTYPSVTPYAFCAGNPINRVDPDGRDWYYFEDEEGERYYYYDDSIYSQKDLDRLGINGTYLGMTYLDKSNNTYYSLFGERVTFDEKTIDSYINYMLYQIIDQLLINYYDNEASDVEGNPIRATVDFYLGIPAKEYSFTYSGYYQKEHFSSTVSGTVFNAFNNRKNSNLWIFRLPGTYPKRAGGYFKGPHWEEFGHFLILSNDKRHHALKVQYDTQNATLFNAARNKQFNRKSQ